MRPVYLWALLIGTASIWVQVASADLTVTGLEVQPRLDIRARGGANVPESLRVMQAEVNIRFSVNQDDTELVAIALSPNFETDMSGRARDMHFSNFYSVWNFGVDKPKLKLGQFVVPFGTLAEYDTHPLILQTPYARTLGVRIDQGLAIEGRQGETDYQLSFTTGNGRGIRDGSYAANLRLARDFEQGDDAYRVGLSLLHGEQMPVFPTDPMPLPMAHHMEPMRADKDRIAVDLDWLHGIDNIRSEMVVGWDDGDFVNGQWLSWNHPFSYETDLTVQADRWQQSDGVSYGLGVSLHHRLDDLSGVRLAFEPRWAEPKVGPGQSIGLVTAQWYRNFALEW